MESELVTGEWLADHLADVRVVDVRWYLDKSRSGRAEYAAAHIPGAVWLDIDSDLSDPASVEAGRHPLPSPERFAAALGRVGIGAGTPVVAYDDTGGSSAARLWWLLHVLGEPVAVLDGGLAAWPQALSTARTTPAPVPRAPRPWPPDRFVTAEQVATTTAHILDARSAERYARGNPDIDPRPGHIPGAISAPWQDNLGAGGRLKSPVELRAQLPTDRAVIAYCGSGVTACHDLLALHRAGVRDLALYPGSWSQWAADPSRPTSA